MKTRTGRKQVAFLLALMMLFSCFAAFLSGCNTGDKGLEQGDDFIVGFDAEFPPYGYVDEKGNYTGFDLELAQELCKRRGWNYVPQAIDWDSKDAELKTGTIDCIWNGFTMTGRESDYTFTNPYVDNSQVIVVRSDSGIIKLKELEGKNVAVQTDSSAQAVLSNDQKKLAATFNMLDIEKDYNTCFLNMDAGAIDAIAMDLGVANYQLDNRSSGKYRILGEPLATEQYAVAFKLGNTALRDEVQETLNEMIEDGTFLKIAEKYDLQDSVITDISEKNTTDELAKESSNKMSVGTLVKELAKAMLTTIEIFLLVLVLSVPLGMLVSFWRMSKNKFWRGLAKVYISIMRGTPLMLQMLIVYFGPNLLFGMNISASYRFPAVIIAFVINYAAYFGEIFRGGIESMEKGQYEAAQILGFSKNQTFTRIILPQVIKRTLPSLTNEVITLVKDTSLAYAIAVTEMFTVAKQLASTQASFVPYIAAFIFYYIFNWIVATIMEQYEKKLSYYSTK